MCRLGSKQRCGRRKELVILMGATCHYCGCELDDATATLEHIWPVSRGGSNRLLNLVLACFLCNLERGDDVVKCFCRKCFRSWGQHIGLVIREKSWRIRGDVYGHFATFVVTGSTSSATTSAIDAGTCSTRTLISPS